ncbi:dynamin family protein [Ancylostoma duodenale]|uniref:Dynamin family protein n=1 Tax=Ancylostoma duodenale TaxID=51022 RepID=A0A0C2HG78_9BILA|nr:dynamin family protein [Ancylostoma duodenale]
MLSDDWAMFEHTGRKIFTDFAEVRKEIEAETDRLTGTNKGISPVPIILRIYSKNVVNLSLVDLPGITKIPVGDQPANIEEQIREMLLSYISNPSSIILAVTPANQDFATSEPIKMAREVDPEGTDFISYASSYTWSSKKVSVLPMIYVYFLPLLQAIIDNKPICDAVKDEQSFLHRKYPTLASRNGTPYLAKKLNLLLMHHIRNCLPALKARVSIMHAQCQADLQAFGEPVVANQVAIELAYINTRHPEFVGEANRTLVNAEEAISDRSRARQRTASMGDRASSANSEQMVNAVPLQLTGDGTSNGVSKSQMVNGEPKKSSSWWFGKTNAEESSEVVTNPAVILPEVPEKPLARQLTRNEQKDCLIIERLIRKYFMIVRKNVQDSVPKAIMHFLVNYVRDNLQSELVRQLYKPDLLEDLLAETADMAQRRKETLETMKY